MHVRKATADDLGVVGRMRIEFLAAFRSIGVDELPPGFADETRAFLGRAHQQHRLHSWLAEDESETCRGVVTMLLSDAPPRPDDLRTDEGYVLNMYVQEEARRRGVGRALFDACLAGARSLDLRRVYLRATDDGRPMYAESGFRNNGEWMELALPPAINRR